MANTSKEAIYNQVAYQDLHNGPLAATSGGGFSQKLTTDLSVTNCESRPNGSMKLTLTFSASPPSGIVSVHFRYTAIDGANPEPDLDANFEGHFRGSVNVDSAGGTTQYLMLDDVKCPKPLEVAEVYLKNNTDRNVTTARVQWSTDTFIPAP